MDSAHALSRAERPVSWFTRSASDSLSSRRSALSVSSGLSGLAKYWAEPSNIIAYSSLTLPNASAGSTLSGPFGELNQAFARASPSPSATSGMP